MPQFIAFAPLNLINQKHGLVAGGMIRNVAAPVVLALCTLPAWADSWPERPDPHMTPGLARSDLTITEICNTAWGTDARHVTDAMKEQLIEECHCDAAACPLTKLNGKMVHRVEIDHLISRDSWAAPTMSKICGRSATSR